MDWNKFDPIGADLLFQSCTIKPEFLGKAKDRTYALIVGEDSYDQVSKSVGIPWWVIGAIHQMECGGSFERHIHNGDPLTNRTVHVPTGRPFPDPSSGHFPYAWIESAIDALSSKYPPHPPTWDVGHALIFAELYNGLGYREEDKPSPYVWSGTNNYRSGKFTADGKFDPNAKSDQVGCAALFKLLNDWGTVSMV